MHNHDKSPSVKSYSSLFWLNSALQKNRTNGTGNRYIADSVNLFNSSDNWRPKSFIFLTTSFRMKGLTIKLIDLTKRSPDWSLIDTRPSASISSYLKSTSKVSFQVNLLLNNFKRIGKGKLGCFGHWVYSKLIAITLKVKVRLLLAEAGNVENGHVEV